MKTEKLIYKNTDGDTIVFSPMSLYQVNISKDVTGLSDISDTIYSTSSMGQHGNSLTGIRIEPRDIQIKGRIESGDKDSYLSLRRTALKILNPELHGTLYYIYGDFTRKIGAIADGSPKFTRSGTFQEFTIELSCLSPFWEEETETREDIASWIGSWEFPTEIDPDDGMEFGEREESVIADIYNGGHVKASMEIRFTALGKLTNPQLFNINTREFLKLNYTMSAGDTITINTAYGKKTATLLSNGVTSNVYRYVDVDSTFMQLEVGDNTFKYDADSGVDNLECTISFTPMYLGV